MEHAERGIARIPRHVRDWRSLFFGAAPAARVLQAMIVAVLCLFAALFGGMFKLDPHIAGGWGGYHYGTLETRLSNINMASHYHAAGLVFDNRDRQTPRALENHGESFYFDDVGYILFAQLYVLAFGDVDEHKLLVLHNTIFVLGLIGVATAFTLLVGGVAPGLGAFALLAALHRLFAGFVYNTASQPGLVIPMVTWIVVALLLLPTLLGREKARWSLIPVYLIGALSGAIVLTRYPIGSGAILAGLATIVFVARTWRRRGVAAVMLLAGFFTVQNIVPGVVEIQRDARMDWGRHSVFSYFRTPPKHEPWFTMLALVGRYDNALDLKILDGDVDRVLVARKQAEPNRWPGDYADTFDTIAHDVLFDYIKQYPVEYISGRIRGALELFAVVPGITFQSKDNFCGSPWVLPTHPPDPHDVRPNSPNQLVNVRFSYLDLAIWQWALYALALAVFVATIVFAFSQRKAQLRVVQTFAGLGLLWALYGFTRALIPWYGQDFVFLCWLLPALGACWMAASYARRLVPNAH